MSSPAPSRPALHHVGTYLRRLPVSLERMYENTLDWEHLPWLHAGSFRSIDCEDAGDWGWRARVAYAGGKEGRIELRLDRDTHRWITTTLEGQGAGTEVWTHAVPVRPHEIDVVVDFFVPELFAEAAIVGEGFKRLYAQLYDEDERMMVERQQALDVQGARGDDARAGAARLDLGPEAELRGRAPLDARFEGERVRVVHDAGSWLAFRPVCPHLLGPLDEAPIEDGTVQCPWHGYRFDLRTRACTSGPSKLRLARAPSAVVEDGHLWLVG